MRFIFRVLLVLGFAMSMAGVVSADTAVEATKKPVIQVFYKEKAPSLETLDQVLKFLVDYEDTYEIEKVIITDPANSELLTKMKLPAEHFPFALAIEGKTSARIGEATIIFAHFPDFMHKIGRHQGNWTLEHLRQVLQNRSLLLPDNPEVTTAPGGQDGKKPE